MMRSSIAAASGRPAPRNAPIGVVFVSAIAALVRDLRDAVDALRHHARRPHRERAAEARVRARVADDATPHADDRAVALAAELDVLHLARDRAASRSGSRSGSRPTSPGAAAAARRRPRRSARPRARACRRTRRRRAARRRGLRCSSSSNIGATRVGEAVRHLRRDVDGELVARAVVAGDDRDRVALHRHHRDALVLDAARTTTSAPSSTSPCARGSIAAARFEPSSSNCSGAPGASAASGSTTAGSGS